MAPQTSVDFVTTLIGAALAAGVAFYILRGQLRHDVELASRQALTDRELAKAAAMRPRVEELATAFLEVGRLLNHYSSEDIGRIARDEEQRAQHDRLLTFWSESDDLIIMEPRRAVSGLWLDLRTRWGWCHEFTRDLLGEDTTPDTLGAAGVAVDALLTATCNRTTAVGKALLTWDGVGVLTLPDSADGPTLPFRGPGLEKEKRAASDEYRRVLRDYLSSDTEAERAVLRRLGAAETRATS
ncbi:hypothetical protein LJR042_000283 [Microbacterium maritypicum]|uniref:hypothetical protein n=1 Tax=Microbacterium TaxID=33882 RepID=UPI00141F6126|nr:MULTISPECIES: hypothetical protein [Microbacterium]NIG66535.1 hypothetical protein [Microbacterium sp. Be9]